MDEQGYLGTLPSGYVFCLVQTKTYFRVQTRQIQVSGYRRTLAWPEENPSPLSSPSPVVWLTTSDTPDQT